MKYAVCCDFLYLFSAALLHAGKDATETFEDIGHTLDARMMADKYIIGRVKGETNLRKCTPANIKESGAMPVRMCIVECIHRA